MADPVAQCRTNYFRVKDLDAFTADLDRHGISHGGFGDHADIVLDQSPTNEPEGAIALFAYDFWPSLDEDSVAMRLGLEDDEPVPDGTHETIQGLVSTHLQDTDVAVFMCVNFEKMRYLGGHAEAINARGETHTISLDDIYTQAEHLATEGTPITWATY